MMGSPVYKPQQTKLELTCEEKFMEHYGSSPPMPDGWYAKHVMSAADSKEAGRMAGLIWRVYERAFYDGFAARLSGVEDERETTDTAPAGQA